MISNGEKWHFVAVKKLSALLRRITSEHHGDFYCLNCFHSFATESKFQSHKRACEIKILVMYYTKILEFIQFKNLMKHHLLFMQILSI